MKREIKFRAISEFRGEGFVYGDLRHYARNPHTEKWTIHAPETGLETDVDETTIGQFTGLHDKYDKEIWEGDVVRCGSFVYEVKYGDKRIASFYLRRDGDMYRHYFGEAMEPYECEVIGNIHDNPELLEK